MTAVTMIFETHDYDIVMPMIIAVAVSIGVRRVLSHENIYTIKLTGDVMGDGRDLTGKTVLQRREHLEQIITPVAGIQVGGYLENRGRDLFALAKDKGLEGIIAKRKASVYWSGKRSPDWLKIKSRPQQEFVVCGFTEGKGSRKHFGALLLAAYRSGRLRYFGHSGTGFSERGLKETIDRLKPLFIDKPTVENPPKIPEKIQWVQPKLVCEVAFAEWTEDEQLRQTTFFGWRDDKTPKEVVTEMQVLRPDT